MKLLTHSILLLFVLWIGCSIEDRIENREDLLIGSWLIDRASFKGDNDLFSDNLLSDFRGDIVTFYADHALL